MKTQEKCRDMNNLTEGKTQGRDRGNTEEVNKLRKSESIIINFNKNRNRN